jgi:hypothetical protein
MKHLSALAFICLLTQAARAHTVTLIQVGTADHPAIILIKGELAMGVEESKENITEFVSIAARQGKAIVFFDSPGGNLATGIAIGTLIRERSFTTAVADYAQCASACALAWLGGAERLKGTKARIGFHAPTVAINTNEISLSGVAYVKRYLDSSLGITDIGTVSLITVAPPFSMYWLTDVDEGKHRGIDFKAFSLSQDEWQWAVSALKSPTYHRLGTYVLGTSQGESTESHLTMPIHGCFPRHGEDGHVSGHED